MLSKRILVLMFAVAFLLLVGCLPSPALPNQAPIITSYPSTTATVGEAYVYIVEATDPDGDTLTYSLITKPTGMTIKSATGLIEWIPKAKGNYAVIVKVSDGALDIIQSFTIVVSKPYAPPCPPAVNHAPIITSIPGDAAIVGVEYTYTIKATDQDGDTLTYSFVSGPEGMAFDTPTISWTPKTTGSYDVKVKVSDGKKATSQGFTITVEAVKLTSIVVNPKTMNLIVGGFEAIESVTAHYSDWSTFVIDGPGYDYGCSSSDNSIATVSAAHVVEAVAEGTATITVGWGEGGVTKTDTIKVTVEAIKLIGIEVEPDTIRFLSLKETKQLTVTAYYNDESKDDTTSDCIYLPISSGIVSVDSFIGLVEARGFGKTIIEVIYTPDGVVFTDTIKVAVGPVHNITQDKYYGTIQAAIDDANPNPGDAIEVAAGTYNENVNINKSLTLQGEDRETTEIEGGGFTSLPTLTISADKVTVSGFTIHSESTKEPVWTILVKGDETSLTDLHVVKDPDSWVGGAAIGVGKDLTDEGNVDSFTFTNSIVESSRNGIYVGGGSSNIEVRNVNFTYPSEWAIMLKMVTGAIIEGNIFTCTDDQIGVLVTRGSDSIKIVDNEFIGSDSSGGVHIGILLQAHATGTMGEADILRNDISGFDTGILVEDVATSGISIHGNNIYDNLSYGVNYLGPDMINATHNWWGDATGPYHKIANPDSQGDAVSDYVDYTSFSEAPYPY